MDLDTAADFTGCMWLEASSGAHPLWCGFHQKPHPCRAGDLLEYVALTDTGTGTLTDAGTSVPGPDPVLAEGAQGTA